MIKFLARLLIKDHTGYTLQPVRRAYGLLCGGVGIILNVLLFVGKLIAGMISGSVAITADAFNNLSDAGSSVVSMLGFKLAAQKPDTKHPFGHGRFEYISGFIVSVIIVVMGIELAKDSINKIIHPETPVFSATVAIILAVSVLVKLYMFIYNRAYGAKIDSASMKATAFDSLSDMASTTVVLASTLLGHFFSWQIDGWCGAVVAMFILITGFKAAHETISPLLGQPPDKALIDKIEQIVLCRDDIKGIHDLIVHNYGPGRIMISLHAEVSADENVILMHDTIDNVERELKDVLGCEAVIHMDPIATDDEATARAKSIVHEAIREIDPSITIHDFRMVIGPTHTNLIFDAVVPFGFRLGDEQLREEIARLLHDVDPSLYAVVQIDKSYTN